MTGMVAWRLISTRSSWEKTRAMIPSTKRESTRAVSATVSPRRSWMSFAPRFRAWPPSWNMPASKDTRVRVDGFWKIMASVLPAQRVAERAGVGLDAAGEVEDLGEVGAGVVPDRHQVLLLHRGSR